MIEVPRGALTAMNRPDGAVLQLWNYDLTQTALGMSRDDAGSFLGPYAEMEIIKKNRLPRSTRPVSGSL